MLFQEKAISTLQTNKRENERTLKVEMDMFTFLTMLNPTVVGIFVMMCATAYAFILDVEAKLDARREKAEKEAQAQQQDAEDLAELKKVVAQEKKQQCNIQKIVYQLLGGLFNQEKQTRILNNHINVLFDNNTSDTTMIGENIFPTTRQGDENEACILSVSKTLQKQQDQLDRMSGSIQRLIEGLYDATTQAPVRTHELELLWGKMPYSREKGFMGMEDECDVEPTTRQGFQLEKRIAALESR